MKLDEVREVVVDCSGIIFGVGRTGGFSGSAVSGYFVECLEVRAMLVEKMAYEDVIALRAGVVQKVGVYRCHGFRFCFAFKLSACKRITRVDGRER